MILNLHAAPDASPSLALERSELRQRLASAGLGELLVAMAGGDGCTKSGRLSVVKLARKMGRHHSYVSRAISRARRLLETTNAGECCHG